MPTKKEKQTELQQQQTEEIEREEIGGEYYDGFTHDGDDLTPKAGQEQGAQDREVYLSHPQLKVKENPVTTVEDIPFEPEPQTNDKAIVVLDKNGTMLAEGVYITPGMPFLEVMRLQTMVTSYTGVKPVKAMEFLGRWIKVLGAVYAPFERETKRLIKSGEHAGEMEVKKLRWKAPLFKLADIDPSTGEHMIVSGGGQAAVEFVQRMQSAGFAGDWDSPVELCFSVESRSGVKEELDKTTGEVTATKEPRNLLRLAVRMPTT